MNYIFTFHSHFYAIRFHKKLKDASYDAIIMPVPRKVSSSCGSCVKVNMEEDPTTLLDDGVEQLYKVEGETLELLYEE